MLLKIKRSLSKKQLSPTGTGSPNFLPIIFKMILVILAGIMGGIKCDEYFSLSFPVFTIGLSLASVAIAVYILIIETKR